MLVLVEGVGSGKSPEDFFVLTFLIFIAFDYMLIKQATTNT